MNTNMLTDLVQAADYANRQSDRWMFIFTLLTMAIFAVVVARFFVTQYQSLITTHRQDQEKYQESLITIIGQQNDTNKALAVNLEKHANAYREVTEAIKCCQLRNQNKVIV